MKRKRVIFFRQRCFFRRRCRLTKITEIDRIARIVAKAMISAIEEIAAIAALFPGISDWSSEVCRRRACLAHRHVPSKFCAHRPVAFVFPSLLVIVPAIERLPLSLFLCSRWVSSTSSLKNLVGCVVKNHRNQTENPAYFLGGCYWFLVDLYLRYCQSSSSSSFIGD